jgi:hypothetical protein
LESEGTSVRKEGAGRYFRVSKGRRTEEREEVTYLRAERQKEGRKEGRKDEREGMRKILKDGSTEERKEGREERSKEDIEGRKEGGGKVSKGGRTDERKEGRKEGRKADIEGRTEERKVTAWRNGRGRTTGPMKSRARRPRANCFSFGSFGSSAWGLSYSGRSNLLPLCRCASFISFLGDMSPYIRAVPLRREFLYTCLGGDIFGSYFLTVGRHVTLRRPQKAPSSLPERSNPRQHDRRRS